METSSGGEGKVCFICLGETNAPDGHLYVARVLVSSVFRAKPPIYKTRLQLNLQRCHIVLVR